MNLQDQAVIGIVFSSSGQEVVILKRRDVPVWVLPGGGVDLNESFEEAVIREIWEETGLRAKIVRKSGHYFPINKLAKETHVFVCQEIEGTLSTGEETREIGYFPISNLPKNFFIVHHDWLEDALNNITKTVLKPITRVSYWNFFKYTLRHPYKVLRYLFSRLGFPINSR